MEYQIQSARPAVEPPSLRSPGTWPQAHQSSVKVRKAVAVLQASKAFVSLVNAQRCCAGSLAHQSSAALEAARKKLRFSPLRFSGKHYANTLVLSGMFGCSPQARNTCVQSIGIEDVVFHQLLRPFKKHTVSD